LKLQELDEKCWNLRMRDCSNNLHILSKPLTMLPLIRPLDPLRNQTPVGVIRKIPKPLTTKPAEPMPEPMPEPTAELTPQPMLVGKPTAKPVAKPAIKPAAEPAVQTAEPSAAYTTAAPYTMANPYTAAPERIENLKWIFPACNGFHMIFRDIFNRTFDIVGIG
jgi:hypothetical protein